jgi:phosphoenolpyruvate synthase/pyruvate phosphate dikinase
MANIIDLNSYVLSLGELDKTKFILAGGKGANLGELCRIEGIHVPPGFCISTEAYKSMLGQTPLINALLEKLSLLKMEDRDKIFELSGSIRRIIEATVIPEDIHRQIVNIVSKLGEENAYAVRSSATAEDLPSASFAGQQDTYLNIVGNEEIIVHVRKCWASLFTDRAVIYRVQNGFDHRKVYLAVVVQKMIFPKASGVLFTADPVTANRTGLSIDASFGLGEALVSGLVNADNYKVRSGKIVGKNISAKKLAVYAVKNGGTKEQEVEPELQNMQTLTDEQILQLERIGRKIEKHFAAPQDIEWCLANNTFYVVQSRPITTLYPIPEANDEVNHVYVSVGHQQMMTDPMKPLGISVWTATAGRQMYYAGGRLFVDVADDLASPAKRDILVNVLGKSDPLIRDALMTILERDGFIQSLPADTPETTSGKSSEGRPHLNFQTLNEYDPSIVDELIRRDETSIKELKQNIQAKSGPALIDFILEDIQQLRKNLSDPQSFGVFMTAINASSWINDKMKEWLGEQNAADIISQAAPNNITSKMGLKLLDVADVIRPYPEVTRYLQRAEDDNFLDELDKLTGGKEACTAINKYLEKYGMRCAGEIDITRPRWSEKPRMLVPMILGNIKNFDYGESKRRFEQGQEEALKKEQELLNRLKQLPDGEQKATETKRMIDLVRNFIGYREYPKYGIVNRYFIYKQALLKETERLIYSNVIQEKNDIFYLSLEELREVLHTNKLNKQVINKRKDEYKLYEKLVPPRVMTSDGEIIAGKYKRENIPGEAIAGLPVSSGVIEGRARVILNMDDANLEDGDILVTKFTDPSWTPLFISIKGLVTEVGGLMTHGAVIAREYGLPAVVGVENATTLITDGQRIRVNGTEGYVKIL